jgi:hypothetical protein
MNFSGGASTTLVNDGAIEAARSSVIDTKITGHGQIDITNAPNPPWLPTPGTLELGDAVGPGQTIAFTPHAGFPGQVPLNSQTLLLDKPAQFQAHIANFEPPGQTIELANTTVTNDLVLFGQYGEDAVLYLWSGLRLAAALHFQGNYTGGDFVVTDTGGYADITFGPKGAYPPIIGIPTHHA